MGLIKSNLVPSNASPFSMADIEAAARRMLLRARGQAEQLLIAAQAEADQMKAAAVEEGTARGYEEGLANGLEQGRKTGHDAALAECREKMTILIESLAAAAQQIEASRRELEATGVAEVVELAIAIAVRVIKCQAAIDPKVLTSNLCEAMSLAVHAADVRITVHPSQKETLERELPNLKLRWPNLQHIELIADDAVACGGCRLGTRHGEVDADLNGQLDRVVMELINKDGPR
jgi:flagellar assembly protein FliH